MLQIKWYFIICSKCTKQHSVNKISIVVVRLEHFYREVPLALSVLSLILSGHPQFRAFLRSLAWCCVYSWNVKGAGVPLRGSRAPVDTIKQQHAANPASFQFTDDVVLLSSGRRLMSRRAYTGESRYDPWLPAVTSKRSACGAKWLHWRSVAAALVAALYNHEVTATPRQYQISTRLWGGCQAATRYLCEASNWKQRSRCCCSVSPSSTVTNNYTEWLASRCMARHTRSSAVADVRFSLFECYCFPRALYVCRPCFRAWKRGFSCPAGRLRLATGRVQTAEWTNGYTVRYLGPIK